MSIDVYSTLWNNDQHRDPFGKRQTYASHMAGCYAAFLGPV